MERYEIIFTTASELATFVLWRIGTYMYRIRLKHEYILESYGPYAGGRESTGDMGIGRETFGRTRQ